jgi:hypothetical protein
MCKDQKGQYFYLVIYAFTQWHILITIGHMSTNACVLAKSTKQYRRRKPQYTPYYRCIEDYYEEFKRTYDRRFSQKYGYLRSHIEKVIYLYLDCGILHNGFARIKCGNCGHESLLALDCIPLCISFAHCVIILLKSSSYKYLPASS